ncbi:MAG: hypothetical protein DMG13_06595 [Acidobacteria bacterium]|nr:MAG: hypothetical protein DMG13_06595 [Acidobacteriota bacterium]
MKLKLESERSFWLFAVVIFILLTGLSYLPVLLGKIPFPRDMVLQFPAWADFPRSEDWQSYADIGDLVTSFYPFRAIASRAIHEQRTLPLWNPYFQSGIPFQADPQTALFYPLHFFYYILPLPIAWTACLIVRMFLAGLFMTLFVRSIGGTKAGSVFSGIIFSSCGFMTVWQGQSHGDSAMWLPLICYAVQRLHRDRSNLSLALGSFAFAMPVLAGHPETAAHVTFAGASMAVVWWVTSTRFRRSHFDLPFLLSFTLAGLLALGLASIQMIPTIEWLGQMDEALKINWPVLSSHQALAWVSRDIVRGPNSAGIPVPESAAYVGMIGLLAASLAPLHQAKKQVVFLMAMTAVALCIAYGIEPIHWLVSHTPVLGHIKNGRMILLANFAIAGLGGLGVSVLEVDPPSSPRRRLLGWCLLAAVFVVAFVLVYELQAATPFKVEFTRRPSFSRALLFASLILMGWRLGGGLRGRLFPAVACSLAAFDLATFSYGFMGFAQRGEIFPPAPVFEFLAEHNDPTAFRIAGIGPAYSANANVMYRAPSADGYEFGISLPRIFALDFTENRMDAVFFTSEGVLKSTDRRLDMLNLKYFVLTSDAPEFEQFAGPDRFRLVFNNGRVAVFENKSVLPRAFLVPASGIEVIQGRESALDRLRDPSFEPERSVILSALPPLPDAPDGSLAQPFNSKVEIIESRINEAVFRAQASEPAILVWSQTHYPGWKATVNEQEVPVFRANLALTGIPLAAGTHDVRFVFRPLSFRAGAILTMLSTLVLATLTVIGATPFVKNTKT